VANPRHMRVRVFAGDSNSFTLYEDDGESNHFEDGARCTTTIEQQATARSIMLKTSAPLGDRRSLPARRRWTFEIVGVVEGCTVKATSGGRTISAKTRYDVGRATLTVALPASPVEQPIVVTVAVSARSILDRTDRFDRRLHDLLLHFDAHCNALGAAYDAVTKHRGSLEKLREVAPALHPSQMRLLCELGSEAGMDVIHDAADNCRLVVLWNNRERAGIRFDLLNGHRQGHAGGAVQRFQRIPYTTFSWGRHDAYIADWGPWELGLDYAGVHRVIARGDGHGAVQVV